MTEYVIRDTIPLYVTFLYLVESDGEDVIEDYCGASQVCFGHELGDQIEWVGDGNVDYAKAEDLMPKAA